MNLELFDQAPAPIEVTPAQQQKQGAERAAWNRRQRRKRARDRQKGRDTSLQVVTSEAQSDAGQLMLLDLSRSPREMSRPEVTPEMAMLLRAFEWLALAGIAVSHQAVKTALEQIARDDNIDIFHAERFLESAIERGVLPKFERSKWVSIPIEMLDQLMQEAS